MDELLAIEKNVGEIAGVIGLQFAYENETINLEEIDKEEFKEVCVRLHLVAKNLQSIREESRLLDLLHELANTEYGIALFSETWRLAVVEEIGAPCGDLLIMRGVRSTVELASATRKICSAAMEQASFWPCSRVFVL